MAIGIRYYEVYFLEPPTPEQVLVGLEDLTGLTMGVAAQEEGSITLFHPAKPTWCLELDWSTDRLAKLQRLLEALPDLPVPPFPTYAHSLSLSLYPGPGPRSYQYVEVSLLIVLLGLGGQLEKPCALPLWAGLRWADLPPLGRWQTLKDYWQ